MMKRTINILYIVIAAILMVGCMSCDKRTENRQALPTDTTYTQQAAMAVYGYQPERALQIIDSAVIVGNLSEVRADVERARIYSMTQAKLQLDSLLHGPEGTCLDSGRVIGERLLAHDSLKHDLNLRQQLLEILVYTARMQQDTLTWMQRSRELVDVCHEQGLQTEALRMEAELGASLCYSGQMEQGMAMLDSVIVLLSTKPSFKFNELDALIIASKRKIGVLSSTGRYVETLPLARRIIERLEDYEAHPDQYADDTKRVLKDSTSRAGYINFYRTQAQGYITAAYSALGEHGNMNDAYKQIERSVQEATAREHIARYNALQQQMQRQEAEARAERSQLITVIFAILLVAALAVLVWYWRQKRIISRKNRALVRQIDEALKYKELFRLDHQQKVPVEQQLAATDINTLTSEQLFQHINEVIVGERLFLDPKFGRQTIIDRFLLSKDRASTIFSQGSSHDSLTDYVQELRLEHAARLLTEQPHASITLVATQSGFASAQYFSKRFRQRFGMSPSDYREAHLPDV